MHLTASNSSNMALQSAVPLFPLHLQTVRIFFIYMGLTFFHLHMEHITHRYCDWNQWWLYFGGNMSPFQVQIHGPN